MERTDPAAAAAVTRHRDALADDAATVLLQRFPEIAQRFGERGERATREDLGSHLDTLAAALDAGEPAVFASYALWAATLLEPRGVPVRMLSDSFAALADAALRRLEPDAAATARAVLGRGIDALEAGDAAPLPRIEPASLLPPGEIASLLIDGRFDAVERRLEPLLERGGYLDVAVHVLQPALYEVGRRWQLRRIGVADEHLATATAVHALTAAFVRAEAKEPSGRRAVFACVENNLHDVGVRMLADAFELAGWRADALGASTPTRDLAAFVQSRRPHLLGLSVALPRQLATARAAVAAVRERLGRDAPRIVVGGLAANELPDAAALLGADAAFADARLALQDGTLGGDR